MSDSDDSAMEYIDWYEGYEGTNISFPSSGSVWRLDNRINDNTYFEDRPRMGPGRVQALYSYGAIARV